MDERAEFEKWANEHVIPIAARLGYSINDVMWRAWQARAAMSKVPDNLDEVAVEVANEIDLACFYGYAVSEELVKKFASRLLERINQGEIK